MHKIAFAFAQSHCACCREEFAFDTFLDCPDRRGFITSKGAHHEGMEGLRGGVQGNLELKS